MYITTSNVLHGLTPTASVAGTGNLSALTDPDHSESYAATPFAAINFGAITTRFIAVSGHDLYSTTDNSHTLVIGDSSLGIITHSISVTSNRAIMVIFPEERTYTDMYLSFQHSSSRKVNVSYIAAGEYFEVPNGGEQAGYARNWLNRGIQQRVTVSNNAAPVAVVTEAKPLKGTLTIPNALISFSRGDWQTFIDYAAEYPFFINEDSTIPQASYLCFDPTFENVRAHGQTRALDSLRIGFSCFNGL